jgi:LysM repeat protein
MIKINASILCILSTVMLAACGTVVTPQPTRGPAPTNTLLPIHTPVIGSAGKAPALPLADTATPTVSPTPIVYVVQSGDTLLGIAMEYGVSVEAVQRANGIQDPQYLRVGQELLIPTGEEDAEASSGNVLLPTPTPIQFDMQGVACYETPVGSLWCMGEVINTIDAPVTNVNILVTLFDPNGQRVAEKDTFVASDLIPPGGRSPFGVLFADPPSGPIIPQTTIVRGEVAGELTDAYISLTPVDVESRSDGQQIEINGSIRNDDAQRAANHLTIIVTTYDADDQVTGFRQSAIELEDPLVPGSAAPFSMLLDAYGDDLADLSIVALGIVSGE